LNNGQQRHQANVDEELGSGQRYEQWQPTVSQPEECGHGRVTDGRAEA